LSGVSSQVSGQLHLTRSGRRIVVRGHLSGTASLPCDRCGETLPLSVEGDIDCGYSPVDALAPPADDAAGDLEDEGEYDGVALDLVHVVREFFALERPPRVLCGDLVPGADEACLQRFRARAHLGAPPPDPRLAALKGVKPVN
jgi:uncharacterized metal-binding protein YceD (DUF177 family)